jgi:ATP-binding cassette subfamily C protein CydD
VAVGPVDLAVPTVGLVAIVGPSGSGKSSLLAALAGLRPLSEGAIDWAAGAPAQAAWAGQRPLVMAGTLSENFLLGGGADAEAAAKSAGLAALLAARGGLGTAVDASGSGLSGGERRRLGLARALASGRALLLLDEPTADLDSETVASILATILDVARTRAVVVATHDPALAAAADVRLVLA